MKKRILFLVIISVLCLSMQAIAEITENNRLLQKPEWDGAIISGKWLNNEVRYQQFEVNGNEDVNFLSVGSTFITSIPAIPNFEIGAKLWLMNANYDHFDSETGLSDIDCWGKYQFYNMNNLLISGGIQLTLPLGSDSILHPRASGETNIELFGAARYRVSEITSVVGHVGLRRNADADVDLSSKNGFDIDAEIEGETQIEAGCGIIYQLQPSLNLLGEFNIATEAYDDSESDIEMTFGAEYMLKPNMSVKGGLGFGLDDGAPQAELIAGCTLLF